jgi:hypothetical protein
MFLENYTHPTLFLKTILILSSQIHPCLLNYLSPSEFPSAILFSPMRVTLRFHLTLLDLIPLIMFLGHYELLTCLTPPLVGSTISTASSSEAPSSLNLEDHVSSTVHTCNMQNIGQKLPTAALSPCWYLATPKTIFHIQSMTVFIASHIIKLRIINCRS